MAKIKSKKISRSFLVYGSLIMLGAVSGQQLGRVITGHSFVAHASGQVNTEAAADSSWETREQQLRELGPCNCPLCCVI